MVSSVKCRTYFNLIIKLKFKFLIHFFYEVKLFCVFSSWRGKLKMWFTYFTLIHFTHLHWHYKYTKPLNAACAIKILAACCVSNNILVSYIHCFATLLGAPFSKFIYFKAWRKLPISIQYFALCRISSVLNLLKSVLSLFNSDFGMAVPDFISNTDWM